MSARLTPEYKELLAAVRSEWVDRTMSCWPIDQEALREGIQWIYGEMGLPMPEIIYAASPHELLSTVKRARDGEGRNLVMSVYKVFDPMREAVRNATHDLLETIWTSSWDLKIENTFDELKDFVRIALRDSAAAAEEGLLELWYEAYKPTDMRYFGFLIDLCRRIGRSIEMVPPERLMQYFAWLKSNVWYVFFFERSVFVCGAPEYIRLDDHGRLHSASGPAMR